MSAPSAALPQGYRPRAPRARTTRMAASFLMALTLGLALPQATAQQAAGTRVAYVDMKRLIDSSPQFLRARERLLREFEAANNLLREDEARVNALEARLREAQAQGNAQVEAAVLAELDPLRRSVGRNRDRLLRELETRSEQEVERAWPLINDAVAEYAREQGIEIVLSSGVAYASGRTDITDRVLDRLQRADRSETRP